MARKILSKELLRDFKTKREFSTAEVRIFYKKYITDIKDSTINWNIYHLIKEGKIRRKKIGVYQINK